MLITVPKIEFFDEEKQEFISSEETVLELEHSLVALSKWESIHEVPFLTDKAKTPEQMLSYVKCMTLTPNVPPEVYAALSEENILAINAHIDKKMTATWINEPPGPSRNREIITEELIRYWMIALQVPVEYENLHLNKLFTIIKVANLKQQKPKKQSMRERLREQHELNERRLAASGGNG